MRNLSLASLFVLAAGSLLFATDITLEGTVTLPQPGKDVWVTNIGGVDYAFVNAGEEGVYKIRIWDRTSVGVFTPVSGAVKDIWVKDTLVFVANYGDTILYILDGNLNPIGKLAEIAASVDTQYRAEAITVSSDTQNVVFIAVRRITGTEQSVFLYVVDAKDPTAPRFAMTDYASEPVNCTDFENFVRAINMGNVSVLDLNIAGHEYKPLRSGTPLSNCQYCSGNYRWLLCTEDTLDTWYIAALLANSDSAWLSIYSYDYFHQDVYEKRRGGSCPGCGDPTYGTHTAPFAYKQDPSHCYYSPTTDSLQDWYTFSTTKAYQMWVGSHAGTEYAFIACGSDGLWVLPLHPGISITEDIGDPLIAGYRASDGDDYRDVYIYGDLIFLANYGDAPGEKLFSVLNAAALEDSTLEETASYNAFFGEGIWGDSLRVYVVGDSL